jgi:BirA family biotin operon repressor/biotin-[acetyl-CoA-carboxylase] ligase
MIIGSEIMYFPELSSTNSYAIQLLGSGRPAEGTIVRAGFQTAGRGQPGNKWESESGKNLLFSIITYPSRIKAHEQFIISMALSLGVHDFVRSKIKGCTIKWPNDIYVKNDKIAGILIENSLSGPRISYSVAGIGFNLNQEKFNGNAPNPVSLKLLTGEDYDPEITLSAMASFLDERYSQLINGEFRQIRNDRSKYALISGKPVHFGIGIQ